MKIRNGFVSNSSSSSFIVIGTKKELGSLMEEICESEYCEAGETSIGCDNKAEVISELSEYKGYEEVLEKLKSLPEDKEAIKISVDYGDDTLIYHLEKYETIDIN